MHLKGLIEDGSILTPRSPPVQQDPGLIWFAASPNLVVSCLEFREFLYFLLTKWLKPYFHLVEVTTDQRGLVSSAATSIVVS